MVKIELENNDCQKISNKWSYPITVVKKEDGYYINYKNNIEGPYHAVSKEKVRQGVPNTTIYGFRQEFCDVFEVLPEGLTLMQTIDRSEELAKEFIRVFDSTKCEKLNGCTFLGKYGKYHHYKDRDGRFFMVNITKPIREPKEYAHFDSMFELATVAKQKGIDCYSEYLLRECDNPVLRRFISEFKRTSSDFGLTNLHLLPILKRVKTLIGVDTYLNLDGELRYLNNNHSYIDLEKLLEEFEKEDLSGNKKIKYWQSNSFLYRYFDDELIHRKILLGIINNFAMERTYNLDGVNIAYNGILLIKPNMTEEDKEANKIELKYYRWQGLDCLKEDRPEVYRKIEKICSRKISVICEEMLSKQRTEYSAEVKACMERYWKHNGVVIRSEELSENE